MMAKTAAGYTFPNFSERTGACRRGRWGKSSLLLILLLSVSCATLRVPETAPSFKAEEFVRASQAGLVLEARPVVDRESYWDLFEDDLPQFGIVAIWVNIRNERTGTVTVGPRCWRLRSAGGEERILNAGQLFEQYYDKRRIRAFSMHSDQEAREKLQPLMLNMTTPLRASETRSGFVFFRIRPSSATGRLSSARLILRDVRLPDRKSLTLELPLTYATP
jgi:hypothetical protein